DSNVQDDNKVQQQSKKEEQEEQDDSPTPTTKSSQQQQKKQYKHTIIPLSLTKEKYKKAKVRYNYDADEDEREIFERQTNGNWTRQVTKVVIFRTTDDQLFLDWDEERTGKTQMGRKKTLPVSHVTKYKIPEAQEDI